MTRYSVFTLIVVCCLVSIIHHLLLKASEKPPVSSKKVLELLDLAGIPAESAKFVYSVQRGKSPQIPQEVCFYRIKWKDAEWEVGVDATTNKIVMLLSTEAVFVPEGKSKPIKRHEDAVRIADIWFQRFGVEIKKTILWEVRKWTDENWLVERYYLLAPDTIIRVGTTVELDEETGGLVGFDVDPDLAIPSNLPKSIISSKEAITLAFEQIAKKRTEHYEPSTDVHLLDCYQFITFKRKSDNQFTVHRYWRIRFYGRAHKISRLTPDFQGSILPKAVPVLWDVLVDSITGEVDIHWVSQRNELFTNGRLYHWE